MAEAYITGMAAAATLTGAELLEVSQLSATVTMTATTISALASDNSYNDSGGGFLTEGFAVNDRVRVTGFTGNVANNIFVGQITALTANKMTIGGADGNVIVDDAAGESVTITKWVSRRTTAQDLANLAEATEASDADIWAGTDADKFISPRRALSSRESVNVTYGATLTLDGDDGLNFDVTLTGASTNIANPVNFKEGQWGRLRIEQDATGGRTATWEGNWYFDGGPPTLSTDPNAIDVVDYYVHSSTQIEAHFRGALEPTPVSTSARYWKLDVTALQSGLTVLNLNEVKLMESGTNRAAGSTVTAVGTSFGNVNDLVDNDLTDAGGFWEYSGALPHWLVFDLGAAYTIDELRMACRNSWVTRVPSTFKLQSSTVGTSGPWNDELIVSADMTAWTYNVERTWAV